MIEELFCYLDSFLHPDLLPRYYKIPSGVAYSLSNANRVRQRRAVVATRSTADDAVQTPIGTGRPQIKTKIYPHQKFILSSFPYLNNNTFHNMSSTGIVVPCNIATAYYDEKKER
jgi:hypothetical protein